MNTETLHVYRGLEEIKAAQFRGEPVVEVPEEVANGNRAQRRRYAQDLARRDKTAAKMNQAAQTR